ncbi:MAG: FumA C-terminus/TtdB family hydratase beta subunit [bacterium]|nr:FumA C-terminus/TtdB family hydratase beta subunit [bacterium]
MKTFKINTAEIADFCQKLSVGDRVLLSGTVFTARDAAHKKISELLKSNSPLPFDLKNATIYYAGPTPTPDNLPIGSCGPTTSGRMDPYTPALLDLGVKCLIGKGQRNSSVCEAIVKNNAVYLCAIGGAGALAAKCIKSCDVIAFDELECESVKKLEFVDFPLIVAIDSSGKNIF